MSEEREPPETSQAESEGLLKAADLADRLEAHEKEARKRLIRAVTATILGSSALGILILVKYDAGSFSDIALLAVLLILLLVPSWAGWWLFAASDLTEVRKAAEQDQILGRGPPRSLNRESSSPAEESGSGKGAPS